MVFGTEFRNFPLVWSLYSPTTRTCIGTSTGGTAWKFAPTPPPERSGELCILKNGFPYPAFRFQTPLGVVHTWYEKKQTSFEREKIYILWATFRYFPWFSYRIPWFPPDRLGPGRELGWRGSVSWIIGFAILRPVLHRYGIGMLLKRHRHHVYFIVVSGNHPGSVQAACGPPQTKIWFLGPSVGIFNWAPSLLPRG